MKIIILLLCMYSLKQNWVYVRSEVSAAYRVKPSKVGLAAGRSNLVTRDSIDRRLLIYSIPGTWDGTTHKRRTHFTWPVYHLEPSEIIYNDLSRIAEVELIYTDLESAEELKEKLGRGVWKEFEYVQKYGDFSLLERKAPREEGMA